MRLHFPGYKETLSTVVRINAVLKNTFRDLKMSTVSLIYEAWRADDIVHQS